MVVRCTKKMLDLLGGRNLMLSEPTRSDDDWYLNLLWIERQKCLLLTHAGTLFSVFRAGVRVDNLRPLGNYLVEAIESELRAEGLASDALSELDRNDVRIAKTASRRTLGFMNEMASELEWHIAHDGGLHRADINELNHALRRMLRNYGGDSSDRSNSSTSASNLVTDQLPPRFTAMRSLPVFEPYGPRQQPHQREQIPHHEIHEPPEQAALPRPTARPWNLTSRTHTESRGPVCEPYGHDYACGLGFDEPEAALIAHRAEIDTHALERLLRRGCAPYLALEIVR
jgi:hypothetical protein